MPTILIDPSGNPCCKPCSKKPLKSSNNPQKVSRPRAKTLAQTLTLGCRVTCSRRMKSQKKRKASAGLAKGALLSKLSLEGDNPGAFCGEWLGSGKMLRSVSPIDGQVLATVRMASPDQYEQTVRRAEKAFQDWQTLPAPKRGELIRQLGNALRTAKHDLGRLVSLEAGKILAEGEGEVQEMIDICDFAVGLSRQLYGLTIASERPQHRMLEQGHPLVVL